ncbi:MAG: uroporphyrinogen decarboxylase family protein [Spirochaetia bacterium]
MTGKERIIGAVEHRETDRVPVDFGGYRSSGIMAQAYANLRKYLGLPKKPIKIYDVIQQLAIIDDDILEWSGADTVELGREFCNDDTGWKPWIEADGYEFLIPSYTDIRKEGPHWYLYAPSGKKAGIRREGMLYFDQIYWPFQKEIPSDLSVLPGAMGDVMWSVPTPPDLSSLSVKEFARGAERLRNSTDKAVIYLFGGNLLEISCFLCGIPEFMMLLAGDPDEAHRLLDGLVKMHKSNLKKYLTPIKEYVDVILFGDDLGMQSGPEISPRMYREFFKPRHHDLWNYAKEIAPVKVMLHSCGGIRPLLDDLIDAGLDAVNPVQISAAGMESRGLKKDFGSRICFWGGGADTQEILPNAEPETVRKHVREQLEIFSPGGGFVFQQVHNIMANVPPENVVAMFETVAEFNKSW